MDHIINDIRYKSGNSDKLVFIHGVFNILHPGHLRLLKFAKDNGDFLVVAIENRNSNSSLLHAQVRLEAIQHSMFVDYAFILNDSATAFIQKLKPAIVVKGSEYADKYNPEFDFIKSYGGKLIFSSGDVRFSTLSLLQSEFNTLDLSSIKKPDAYLTRHQINPKHILEIVTQFNELDILVIGDTILDEYITCEPLGMSQEDPTIVVSPISSDIFLGGAGIVAAHAAGLGAKVDFFTILGDDYNAKLIQDKLLKYKVNARVYQDSSRPTTLKQRFRANKKTLLRVNHLKQHHIDVETQDKILEDIKKVIHCKNIIVFSDFSYGCLPQRLIDNIIQLGLEHNIMMVADSQSSSQTGDISKFHHMTLVTPTEREARLAVNDFEAGLIILAEKLRQKSNIKNIFITLGSEGVLIHADNNFTNADKWLTEQIEALNLNPKDVAGAGDSLLISAAMAIALGATVLEGAYIGSVAAACQVGRLGNIPLQLEEIRQELSI